MRRNKGFTLIELLVVIAVLGVLAAGVIVAINPLKRMQQANDAKIRNDVGQIATAMQAYFTTTQYYPATVATLVNSKDLKNEPLTPAGLVYTVTRVADPACTVAPYTNCEVAVSAPLNDPLVTGNVWCWRSSLGTAVEAAACPAP